MPKVGRAQEPWRLLFGRAQAQMASTPSAGWVLLLMMSLGHCRLQQLSSIAGLMQPSTSPQVSSQRLLIHLPDPRPSPQLCAQAGWQWGWRCLCVSLGRTRFSGPFTRARTPALGRQPLFWKPAQLPSFRFFVFFNLKAGPSVPCQDSSHLLGLEGPLGST